MKYIISLLVLLGTGFSVYKWVDLSRFDEKKRYIIIALAAIIAASIAFGVTSLAQNDEPEAKDKIATVENNNVKGKDKVDSKDKADKKDKSDKKDKTDKNDKSDKDDKSKDKNDKSDKSDKSENKADKNTANKDSNKGSSGSSNPGGGSKPSSPSQKPQNSNTKPQSSDKVEYKTWSDQVFTDFSVIEKESDTVYKGDTKVEQQGKQGYKVIEYTDKYVNGVKTDTTSKVVNEVKPVDKIVLIGTGSPSYSYDDAASRQAFNLINAYRVQKGLPEFTWDGQVASVAQTRAFDITDYYSHTRPDGSSYLDLMNHIDYWDVFENIGAGQATPHDILSGWQNSVGHNNALLHPDLTHAAVATVNTGSGDNHWVFIGIERR